MSLEAPAPQRMMNGARASGAEWRHGVRPSSPGQLQIAHVGPGPAAGAIDFLGYVRAFDERSFLGKCVPSLRRMWRGDPILRSLEMVDMRVNVMKWTP
jgi:hypothetical protein